MSGSKLIELIRQQAAGLAPRGIELATVITPPPNLRIRIDNMNIHLEGDDLIVCAHLLPATRYANLHSKVTPAPPDQVTYNGQTFYQAGDNIDTQHTVVAFQDNVLNAGDRVAVMALPGGQQYLVIDKVVIMGG
ncbi:MAG: DUF2577 domain-containing protein [Desulfotomaculales bacterium]